MFLPPITDFLTLEYIRKSLSSEQLAQAEAFGAFDLLKSNLHPQKVLVHGKHGPYYATRMVSDGQPDGARASVHAKVEDTPRTTAKDIERYAGRKMTDIYAEEGAAGVMRAMGAQYAEKGKDEPSYQMDRLEAYYGHGDGYTPEAAARAMQIWTGERLRVPETEDMDEEELSEWYNDLPPDEAAFCREDGTMWGCTLMRQIARSRNIDTKSESEVTSAVCCDILQKVMRNKSRVYPGKLFRGVVMPEGTIEALTGGDDVDLGAVSSFTRSDGVALRFLRDSPVWDNTDDTIPESIVFVLENAKSYKVEQSAFASEQEHLVDGSRPFRVSKIAVDSQDGDDFFEMDDEDTIEMFLEDHVYYVYLEEAA